MALEIDVGKFRELILIDIGRQIVSVIHRDDLANDLEKISLGMGGLPIYEKYENSRDAKNKKNKIFRFKRVYIIEKFLLI